MLQIALSKLLILLLVNSTLSKETYCGVHANGGLEVGVASTKSFTSQILTLVMFALMMAEDFMKKQGRIRQIVDGLKLLPGMVYCIWTYRLRVPFELSHANLDLDNRDP